MTTEFWKNWQTLFPIDKELHEQQVSVVPVDDGGHCVKYNVCVRSIPRREQAHDQCVFNRMVYLTYSEDRVKSIVTHSLANIITLCLFDGANREIVHRDTDFTDFDTFCKTLVDFSVVVHPANWQPPLSTELDMQEIYVAAFEKSEAKIEKYIRKCERMKSRGIIQQAENVNCK